MNDDAHFHCHLGLAFGAISVYISIKFSVTVHFLMLDVKEPKF